MTTYGAGSGAAVVVGKTVEFNRRLLAAFLALVFVLTTLVVGVNVATKAQGTKDGEGYGMLETVDEETGLVLRKGLLDTGNDTYSLKMEAYATKNIATKTIAANTPLDIVMVMDQSKTMEEPDVWTGEYKIIQENDEDKNTFSVDEATGKYIKVGDKFYEVKYRQGQYAYDSAGDGPWTVTGAGDGSHYYYSTADDKYYLVQKGNGILDYTKYTGITLGTLAEDSESWHTNIRYLVAQGNYYAYDSGTNNVYPLFYRCNGYTLGYWAEFYYVANSSVTSSSEDAYNNSARHTTKMGGSNTVNYTRRLSVFEINSDSKNTKIDIPLYKKISKSNTPNHLYWSTDDSDHLLGTEVKIDPDLQPAFSDELFVKCNGYELYYEDDNKNPIPIWNYGVKTTTETAYKGTLYERINISRQEATQTAATDFAKQIAATVTEKADHRIAIVGFNNSGEIKTDLVPAKGGDDIDPENTVNDAIDSAIDSLGATGNSNLTAGLSSTEEVFKNNPIEDSSRKRIVIIFGDEETWNANVNNEVRTADAVLKDTYNALVYTVGLFKANPDDTIEQFMKELSSEYFSSASAPTNYKEMNDGTYHYIAYCGSHPTDDDDSVYKIFNAVGASVPQISATKTVLDSSNTVLKDIITNYFNVPNDPDIDFWTETSSYNSETGNYDWTKDRTRAVDGNNDNPWDSDSRTITIDGFDYNKYYVTETNPGKKLVVTISGLELKKTAKTESDKRLYSNTAKSGIYKKGATEAEAEMYGKFPRPYVDKVTDLAPEGSAGTMNDDGIVVNKYLTPASNGTYDLTVEAYTTTTNSTTMEKIPTDFVVVADQSGSMSEEDMPTGFEPVTGSKNLEEIANGEYYALGEDGNYYRIYGSRNYLYRYYPANYWYVGSLIDRFGTDLGWFMGNTESDQTFSNQMFFREEVNGNTYYQPISMYVKGTIGTYYINFQFDSKLTGSTYKFDRDVTTYSSNGNSPWYRNVLTGSVMQSGTLWSAADAAVQTLYPNDYNYTYSEVNVLFSKINTGMYVNYPMYDRHIGYNKLCYRDAGGNEVILDNKTWEYCDANGNAISSRQGSRPTYSGLYKATGHQRRLKALQNALNEFAEAVAAEKNSDGTPVDNKIAIVGFSSDGFNNNELLTNENSSVDFNASWTSPSGSSSSQYSDNGKAHDGIQKSVADADSSNKYYKEALVSVYDATASNKVNTKVTEGIKGLTAHGGTEPATGLEMAHKILANRENKTYTISKSAKRMGEVVDRKTIVIFFTDGRPGNNSYVDQYSEANKVVEASHAIKELENPKGSYPSVFSIGVFSESDGNPLTYPAHDVTKENNEYKYELGYMDTVKYTRNLTTRYAYLNRNWRSGNPADYGTKPSDTIYDYMSVVSSNYPNATQYMKVKSSGEADLSGTNYLTMIENVRGAEADIGSNAHYRMASNQDTLVAAFSAAVTVVGEQITDSARLDASSVMQDVFNNTNFIVQDGYTITPQTVEGSMDKNGVVTFKPETAAYARGVTANLSVGADGQTVTVKGFDYIANYINNKSTDADGNVIDTPHDGKKLVVTITNVAPTTTGDKFYSNVFDNHQSSMHTDSGTVQNTDFPTPKITRHKYTLDVQPVNTNATFTVAMTVYDAEGNPVNKGADELEDAIIEFPNGKGYLYSDVGNQTFLAVGDKQSFYLSNLPEGYKVKVDVTSTDDAYEYSIWFDENAEHIPMEKGKPISHTFDYEDDHVIHISSKRGNKQVSIREQTIGSYGDTTHRFGEVITMEIPVVVGETETKLEYNCTFSDKFSGFDSELPKDATYVAVFEPTQTNAEKTVATLASIKYTKANGETGTWNLQNKQLPMRDGDVITFTDVPVGNTVKTEEPTANKFEHEVYYYYGQNNVAPSGIKLMTSAGELKDGEYTLTFQAVDGTKADPLEVTFVDGNITKVNGKEVANYPTLNIAQYQSMYIIDNDMSDAYIDIDGSKIYFTSETDADSGKTGFIATIKRQTFKPPVSVTVEKNDMDILIINERGDIEIEGIFDSNHNVIIYILAGAGALALAAGGYYVWKKKDEFVEE